MPKISIIIPTYNEKDNVKTLYQKIDEISTKSNLDYELIFVDDDSPDGTGELALRLSEENNRIKVIIRKNEKSIGSAIKVGIENSKGGVLVFMDGDLSHPPEVIPRLIGNLFENDVVIASRYLEGGSMDSEKYKFYLSKLLNLAIQFILGISIKDSTGGFIALHRSVLDPQNFDKIFYGYGDYCFRLLFNLKDKGLKIKEIPFHYSRRLHGSSKTSIYSVGIKYLLSALSIKLKSYYERNRGY
ncbi:MAG: glycosyltransferase [Methanobacteriota archaeon]